MATTTTDANLTFNQAREYLNVPERTMRRYVAERRIRHYRLGGKSLRFTRADLDAFLQAGVVEAVR